jgi:formyl-CoA transferase
MAAGGYLSLNGDPDRPPLKPYGEQSAYQAGLHAALGTLAALRARDHAGGQHVDVAQAEAAGFLLAGALQRFALMGRPQVRNGPRPASFAPNRLYPSTIRPCADGYVHVHCHNRFPDLISVLMQEPRLAAPDVLAEPLGHADEIDALMDGWLATRDRATAVGEAQELRIPITEVFTPAEVLADVDGHHGARGFFVDVEHPAAGMVRQPGAPVVMRDTPWRIARAPLLGEQNVDIYCGELGVTLRQLGVLRAAGVV